MLFSETSAAAFLLARFLGLPRVPSSARVPGVAHPFYGATESRLWTVRKPRFRVIFQKTFNVLFQIVVF